MKKTILTVFLVCLSSPVLSAPFVTPAMMKRNGLTDEQYELLWKQGKNPQIDVATARDWVFRASRYENVVDWLNEIGKTDNFAKLAARIPGLTETNSMLVATNRLLTIEASTLRMKAETYYAGWTNSYVNATNYYAKLERMAGLINAEIERLKKDKADIEEKIDNAEYILLRPWLRLRLAAVDAAISKLEEGEEGGA